MVRTRVVETARGAISVLALGNPRGRPVVMIPGLTDGLGPVWLPEVQATFRDLPLPMDRIYGLVPSYPVSLDEGVRTEDLAVGLAMMLEQLLPRAAALVCHSLGGMVAQHLVAQRPDLVDRLVLSATSAVAGPTTGVVLRRWDDHVRAQRFATFVQDAVGSSFTGDERTRRLRELDHEPAPDPTPDLVARHHRLTDACCAHDAADAVESIRVPTLVLGGRADAVIPCDETERLAELIPGARFVGFDDVGHGFPDQIPGPYHDLVGPFVLDRSVGSRPARSSS